jgi:hypothetical protein
MEARRYGNLELAKRGCIGARDGNASVEALQLAVDLAREAEDEAAFDGASALLARYVEQKTSSWPNNSFAR